MPKAMKSKEAIRERMLRRRAAGPVDPAAAGRAVADRLDRLRVLRDAGMVAGYCAFQGEVDVTSFLRRALSRGLPVLLPRFDARAGSYVLALVADFDRDVRPGRFGIAEPGPECPAVPPERWRAADTGWLIPGVAFEPGGNRLGRGGGHYDALLRGAAGIRVGIAFDWQVVESLPAEPHDEPMDFVVTERRVIRWRRSGRAAAREAPNTGKVEQSWI
jgi:5-formyltetrahydrofolate cyclo-ligase